MVGVTNKQILTSGPLQAVCAHTHKHETFLSARTTRSLQVHKCTAKCKYTAIKAYRYTDLQIQSIHTQTHTHTSEPFQHTVRTSSFIAMTMINNIPTLSSVYTPWSQSRTHKCSVESWNRLQRTDPRPWTTKTYCRCCHTVLTAVTGQSWWVARFLVFMKDVTPTALLLTVMSAIKNLKPCWMLGEVIYKTLLWSFNLMRA